MRHCTQFVWIPEFRNAGGLAFLWPIGDDKNLQVQSIRGSRYRSCLAEEVVAVGENEAFYLRGASPDYLDGRRLEKNGTYVFALKVMNGLMRKSANRVKSTAFGRKVQKKNPENAGTIDKRNRLPLSPMRMNNNVPESAVLVDHAIIECLSQTQHSIYEVIWRFKATGYIAAAVRKSSTRTDYISLIIYDVRL
jgi:hypothetical protein